MATRRRRPKSEDGPSSVSAPTVRVFTNWTPAKIRAAERQTESGDLTIAAALCDWLLSDDRVCAALDARIEALLGLVPTFEPSGDKRRSNRAVKALEAGEDFWKAYPESQLALMLKWGLLLGVGPARHGWRDFAQHGGRSLPMPRFWHPQTLRRDHERQRWTIRDSRQNERVVTPGDGEWILYAPFGEDRPWAYGLWRSLSRWVLLKYYAIGDSGTAGEKAATTVGTSPEGSTFEQRQKLAQELIDSGEDRTVILAAGYDLKLLELSAQTGQFYKSQIAMADAAIAIRIRGGNLSTEVKEGSRAAAEVQERTGDQAKLRFDAESLATTLNEQSLSWWAEYNFGDSRLAPWPHYPTEPEEDKKASAETVNTLADGLTKLDKLGFELDEKKLIERFELDFVTGRKSPEQRAKEAQDAAAAAGGQPGAAPKDPKGKGGKPQAGARGDFTAALASGASLADNPGFVAGQLHVDGVVESATAAANAALEPTLEAIAKAIDESTSYEDLRKRLRELHADLSAEDMNELVYRAMLLGELAGRRAVTQDS